MKRPKSESGSVTATKQDAIMIDLLGKAYRYEGVALTHDQINRLKKVYGFTKSDDNLLTQAGDFRNLTRYVQEDGIRVMAFLSRYLEPGEDPVKLTQRLCIDAGFDVPDYEEDDEEG